MIFQYPQARLCKALQIFNGMQGAMDFSFTWFFSSGFFRVCKVLVLRRLWVYPLIYLPRTFLNHPKRETR